MISPFLLLNRPIFRLSVMSIKSILKIRNQQKKKTKEKVSGPDPLNHDYIRYSDIQIR